MNRGERLYELEWAPFKNLSGRLLWLKVGAFNESKWARFINRNERQC